MEHLDSVEESARVLRAVGVAERDSGGQELEEEGREAEGEVGDVGSFSSWVSWVQEGGEDSLVEEGSEEESREIEGHETRFVPGQDLLDSQVG